MTCVERGQPKDCSLVPKLQERATADANRDVFKNKNEILIVR
jgi:pyridoxine 5'-phosphate synthase PdxJ